jgi:hypothetical protein
LEGQRGREKRVCGEARIGTGQEESYNVTLSRSPNPCLSDDKSGSILVSVGRNYEIKEIKKLFIVEKRRILQFDPRGTGDLGNSLSVAFESTSLLRQIPAHQSLLPNSATDSDTEKSVKDTTHISGNSEKKPRTYKISSKAPQIFSDFYGRCARPVETPRYLAEFQILSGV